MDGLPKSGNDNPDPIIKAHSDTAKHEARDSHGRFIKKGYNPTTPNSPNPPPPNPSYPSYPSIASADAPLFEAKVNNPFAAFFNWLKKLIKNEGINIKIKPLTAIAIAVALTGGGGIVGYVFPHSSPILHREVVYQGTIQKTPGGYILTLPNSDLYTLKTKSNSMVNFQNLPNGQVMVKGNLTRENFVIEVSEIIPLSTPTSPNLPNIPNYPNPSPATNSGQPSY